MIEELDIIALTEPMPEYGLITGERGTVVMVYGNHEAYEVEFMEGDDSPYTKALVTVTPDKLTLVERYAPTTAIVSAD